ncbi:MAG: translation initiation factor IF-2 subunit alpha [Methanocellales archaeon]|nr:translation initiation factor IF-2 subunit alpha [Methanocellales archaeon]
MRKEWPEQGELVVCTVKKVVDFGAFVGLDEYGDKEGLIHVSEVASGWIKYIRDHIREGQKIVCKVLNVVPTRGHIDLSLKDVNQHQRSDKIHVWKNEQKAEKMLRFVASEADVDFDQLYDDIGHKLVKKFGSIYLAFEDVVTSGCSVLTDISISKEYADIIVKVARENVKLPIVDIAGYVSLTCPLPNGVEVIKDSLKTASEFDVPEVDIEVSYVGAPKYRIRVTAPDYKRAEVVLRKIAEAAIKIVEKSEGVGKFHRDRL